jgi:hypothetical protein
MSGRASLVWVTAIVVPLSAASCDTTSVVFVTEVCPPNLLQNPSFDQGVFQGDPSDSHVMFLVNQANNITNWEVLVPPDNTAFGNRLPWAEPGNVRHLVGSDGPRFVNLAGARPGSQFSPTIEQSLQVSRGWYHLSFDLGQMTPPDGSGSIMVDVELQLNNSPLRTDTVSRAADSHLWEPQARDYLVTQDGTLTLRFHAPAQGNANIFIGLDHLSLQRRGLAGCLEGLPS